jgi:hypothetical protein
VYVARSTDGAQTFGTPRLLTGSTTDDTDPALALVGSAVVCAWAEDATGSHAVRVAVSTDGGASFGAAGTLASGLSTVDGVGATADAGGAFTVTWAAPTGVSASEVWTRRTTDNGGTWSGTANLSANAGASRRPQVAGGASGFVVHVWLDDSASAGTFDVLGY